MKKVIVLLGPTGVGKTGASILLAKALGTHIISADSMQIYKGMDIGTAKPSREERAMIRHHMMDIVPPSESYSTGRYISDVIPVIEGLLEQGKCPVIVGGTGLYIKAMTRGMFSGPSSDPALRDNLLLLEEEEKGTLYSSLLETDAEAAAKIERHDIRRIVRALEVCIKSNDKMSSLQKDQTSPLPYEFIKIGLTRERKELYAMIDRRVDEMIGAGLIEEVEHILGTNPDRTPLQAIGYKELALYLNHEIDLEEAIRLIKRNSRRYAKRQLSWFKNEENISWVDVSGLYSSGDIFIALRNILRKTDLTFGDSNLETA